MTFIPFDSKVYDNFLNSTDVLDINAADYATNVLGDQKLKEMLNDAALIGKSNERLESCLNCMCIARCCLPCTYLCCFIPSDGKPQPILEKWQTVMKEMEPDIEFEMWFRPGNIWLSLFAGSSIMAQKTFGFVIRPSKDAILKAAAAEVLRKAEEAKKQFEVKLSCTKEIVVIDENNIFLTVCHGYKC